MLTSVFIVVVALATIFTAIALFRSDDYKGGDLWFSLPAMFLWMMCTLMVFDLEHVETVNQLENTVSFVENVIANDNQLENVVIRNYTEKKITTSYHGAAWTWPLWLGMMFLMFVESLRVYLNLARGANKKVKEAEENEKPSWK